jgi:hypothetical protein
MSADDPCPPGVSFATARCSSTPAIPSNHYRDGPQGFDDQAAHRPAWQLLSWNGGVQRDRGHHALDAVGEEPGWAASPPATPSPAAPTAGRWPAARRGGRGPTAQDCEEDAVAGSARWPPHLCAPARLLGQPGLVAAAGEHRRVRTRGQRTRLADAGSPQVSGAAYTASAAGSGADDRRTRSATRWAHLATTLPPGRMTGYSASCPLALVPLRKRVLDG